MIFISCNITDKNHENNKLNTRDKVIKQNSDSSQSKNQLSIGMLMKSKWIIGEVGLNGEQPDTIIFNKSDSLIYVSTVTGREECCYLINNDTLIFVDHRSSYDYGTKSDINEKYTNKLKLINGKLHYIESIVEVNNTRKVNDLRNDNLYFTKLK